MQLSRYSQALCLMLALPVSQGWAQDHRLGTWGMMGNQAIDPATGKILPVPPRPPAPPPEPVYTYTPVPLTTVPPARELARSAEIMLVSGYEPSSSALKVHVDRPNARVLLVLTSYSRANWKVSASPRTRIVGIIVSGYYEPSVASAVPVQGYLAKLPYADETEGINFVKLLATLRTWFGTERVDFYRGGYHIPDKVAITAPDPRHESLTLNGPMPVKPVRNFMFKLTTANFKRQAWFLTGPVGEAASYSAKGRMVLAPSGREVYQFKDDKLVVVDVATGEETALPLRPGFPAFSWAMDVAYDSKRDIVSVASLGGEGFLYRYDAVQKKWLDFISLNNIDINSLAYDAVKDRYVAWQEGKLVFLSPDGQVLMERDLRSKLAGFGRLYDVGNEQPPRLILAPNGDDVALVYVDKYEVTRIWWYNALTDMTVLTYKTL